MKRYFRAGASWLDAVLTTSAPAFRDDPEDPTRYLRDLAAAYGLAEVSAVEVADVDPDPRTGVRLSAPQPAVPSDPDIVALKSALDDPATPPALKAIIRRLGVR